MADLPATALIALDSIPDGGAVEVHVDTAEGSESVVVVRQGDSAHAYLNVCPHAGRLLNWAPGRFLFDHGRLVCAAHGAIFEVETGLCIDGPCRGSRLQPVAVCRTEDGNIEITCPTAIASA